VLSDVLRTVRLTGAVFFVTEASSPWVLEIPDGATLAPAILPSAQHVVSYHVVIRGSGWGGLRDGAPVRLETGDVLVFPHGDAYVMSLESGMRGGPNLTEILAFFRQMAAGQLPFTVREGSGGPERLDLVCGFLGCDARPFNPLLATLPRLLHVRRAFGSAGHPLSKLIELTIAESQERRAGGECVRLRLSELMFVEVVRQHLAMLPGEQTGWLAGLRDPLVGRALALVHDRPAHSWTLPRLAKEVGSSRSTLADRFTRFVGQPPMRYLAHWRMQLAARLLADGSAKVSAIAWEVGYDSEAAFSRGFKKIVGMAPATWRQCRAGALHPVPRPSIESGHGAVVASALADARRPRRAGRGRTSSQSRRHRRRTMIPTPTDDGGTRGGRRRRGPRTSRPDGVSG
jgi:AraC-like DNA-binding protein